jgi:hypothetical protein
MLTLRDQRLFRESYSVELDDWDQMVAELLLEVVADAGSIEVAARALGLDVPGIKARVAWARTPNPNLRESYVVGVEQWDLMVAGLLLTIVTDTGSARAAAKALGVPRSTLATWVRRARELRGQLG